ncbi:MAG: hypothetical protein WCE69_12105 [Aestuariivirga sp.]
MAAARDRRGREQSMHMQVDGLQWAYHFALALLASLLLYLVWGQQADRAIPHVSTQESKASAGKLSNDDRAQVIRQLESDLIPEPLNLETLKKLVIYWAAAGARARSDRLTLILAQRSFRDIEVQAMALGVALQHQDHGQAVRILDRILRTKTGSEESLFPLLRSMTENRDARQHLAKALAGNPPWRSSFMIDLANNGDTLAASELISLLKSTDVPAQPRELKPLIIRLLAEASYEKAYYLWLDGLPVQDLKKVGLVFDGGFESHSRSLSFDWTIQKRKNVDVRIVSKGNSQADNALLVDFANSTSQFADVSQILYLAHGSYRFEGDAKAENLQNERGLVWQITCLDPAGHALATTAAQTGTSEWRSFAVDFTVPAARCPMQRLILLLDAKTTLDQRISGRVWYDNLKISNLDGIAAE